MTSASEPYRGAVAVITDSAGRLLLNLRDDRAGISWPGYWSVLGGGCDPGEHPDDAIVRELQEEAGLGHLAMTRVFEIEDLSTSGVLTVYTGTWDGDAATLLLGEGQEHRLFEPSELADLRIPPHIREAILRSGA